LPIPISFRRRYEALTTLIQLSDAEIAAVAGGAIDQSISITASQSNSSDVSQSATASNSGRVTATAGAGGTAAAVGASATNFAAVTQTNIVVALNLARFGRRS
jgi:3-hydroxy-3-methylglutaryl CoA synthase